MDACYSPSPTPRRTLALCLLAAVLVVGATAATACAAPGPPEATAEGTPAVEQDQPAQGEPEQDEPEQGEAELDEAEQDEAEPGYGKGVDGTSDSRPGGSLDGEYRSVEIATVGWDQLTRAPIVLLRELGSGQVVPIWVGVTEARAIALALHEVTPPRPMTHDLLAHLVDELGGELEEVVVHDLVDSTYYGLLRLRVPGREEPVLVDTRPSDGLALAARTGAAISIAVKILRESPDYDFLAPDEGQQVVRLSGLTLVSPTAVLREQFELGDEGGVLVTRATGVAAVQGLQRGDLILEIADEPVASPMDFLDALQSTPPEEPLELTVLRQGERLEIDLFPDRSPPGGGEDRGPKRRA